MVVLDSDHYSILQERNQPECNNLEARLSRLPLSEVTISIISFQEQVRGWLSYIKRVSNDAEIVAGYGRLQGVLVDFVRMRVLAFDAKAQQLFVRLRRQKIRVPTLDLRIASIALAHQAILLTRNRKDFAKVPGLTIEDWTR